MAKVAEVELGGANEFLKALRDPGHDLREKYRGKPLELAAQMGLMLPKKPLQVMQERGLYIPELHGPILPGLRDLIYDVCTLKVEDAAVVGPRGGGKSKGVSFIEFYLAFLEGYDALNLGGSELQADQVYQYMIEYLSDDEYWMSLVDGEPLQSKTTTIWKNWIRVLTASQKSVRSPHAGGRRKGGKKRGGVLVIDEEAEAEEDIVEAAMGTINTAQPSVNIRSSTFHNAEGSFANLMENYEEMGYTRYSWDVFDVAEPCDCVGSCQSPEPCFREDHVEKFINDEGKEETRLVHRAYCGGRSMYADGWVPQNEIIKMWRRWKRNHSRFEVEAMGSRPTSSGHVIKSQYHFSKNIVKVPAYSLRKDGGGVTICVDWGSVNAGLSVWQEHVGDKHALLEAEFLSEHGQSEIFGKILERVGVYGNDLIEIAADIGGGGDYFNKALREEHNLPVRDVSFAEQKEAAAAAFNIYNEAEDIIIPEEHEEFIHQIRRWKRKNGKIQKGGDHLCDTALCYFSKFIDRLDLNNIRIIPRTFSTNGGQSTPKALESSSVTTISRPMVRTIGRRRRR